MIWSVETDPKTFLVIKAQSDKGYQILKASKNDFDDDSQRYSSWFPLHKRHGFKKLIGRCGSLKQAKQKCDQHDAANVDVAID